MREVKHTVPLYSFYDRTGIQNYLDAQAEKGWMLEKAGTMVWRFRRMEPRKLKFSVVYFPGADVCDPRPGENEQSFREYCEYSGWKFAASHAQMQIFYSANTNPVPIDTDPVIEVENIHKSMKKSELLSHWLLLISAVLQIISQCLGFATDPLQYLSWNINLYFILFWPSMLLICIARLVCYYRWYRRAKRAAEDGEFLASRGFNRVEAIWGLVFVVGLAVCVIFSGNKISSVIVIVGVVVGLGLVAVSILAREYFKNRGYSAAQNKVRTIIVTVAATMILSGLMTAGAFYYVDKTDDPQDLAIELSNLMDVDYSTMELANSESILLGRQRIVQYTKRQGPMTELQYQVTHVKAKFLYDLCLQEEMDMSRYEILPADGTPWGAMDAWVCLYDEEVWGYVLCYEDYIVCFWPNWEMTEEQMATIGDIFN